MYISICIWMIRTRITYVDVGGGIIFRVGTVYHEAPGPDDKPDDLLRTLRASWK